MRIIILLISILSCFSVSLGNQNINEFDENKKIMSDFIIKCYYEKEIPNNIQIKPQIQIFRRDFFGTKIVLYLYQGEVTKINNNENEKYYDFSQYTLFMELNNQFYLLDNSIGKKIDYSLSWNELAQYILEQQYNFSIVEEFAKLYYLVKKGNHILQPNSKLIFDVRLIEDYFLIKIKDPTIPTDCYHEKNQLIIALDKKGILYKKWELIK